MNTSRHALYFVPRAGTALASFGERVLGNTSPDWQAATAEPRRYGFHATLKAPFHFAEGRDHAGLSAALRAFAANRPPVRIGRLCVRRIGHFVALVPLAQSDALSGLAADTVTDFEPFRAPLDAQDLARRRASGLTAPQQALLERWGYPYVLAEFRFHMTLTGPLAADEAGTWLARLTDLYAPQAGDEPELESIALLQQPDRTEPFRLVEQVALQGTRL
jgi:Protein of unknown function (DUF1045)